MDEPDEFDDTIDSLDRKHEKSRLKEKDDNLLKLMETVFDNKTRLILFSMINKGMFKEISGAISTGKEANVYYALTSDGSGIAIKIFRIDAPSFKNMRGYVKGDYRFRKVSSRRSSFIEVWAKKEFKNLQRMKEHDVPVPQPIYVERNILLMEFLGTGEHVLPLLRDCDPDKPRKLYRQIMETVRTIFRKCKLVHADLSPYNILFNEVTEQFHIIDVSQAVLIDHPKAMEFLLRDLHNINQFFLTFGVQIIELKELFKWITGVLPNEVTLYEISQK